MFNKFSKKKINIQEGYIEEIFILQTRYLNLVTNKRHRSYEKMQNFRSVNEGNVYFSNMSFHIW